jgi:cell wall-associated NlpC family hydrolase
MWALARAGISAPHSSFAQYAMGSAVSRSDIRRGDLVFFDSFGAGASHVGLAISPTTAVSATDHGVMTHPIFDAYWGGHYVGARRPS